LKLSVDSHQTTLGNLALSIGEAIERLDGQDDDIGYLSGVLSTLNLKALRHAIANVGILRPEEAHELFLKIDVFDSIEMSAKLGTIDLSSPGDWQWFEALLVNNGENAADLTLNPLLPTYFPGTQWVLPADLDAAIREYGTATGFQGLGPAFNNSPVNIKFLGWLEDKGLASDLDAQSRFYLRFYWYYADDGVAHQSDHFSMVVPSSTEVGAKAGASVSKSEIYELKQALETDVATAAYLTDEDIEELDGEADAGLMTYPTPGFYANPFQCTILEDFASSTKKIILQSYSSGKTYKLKFTTGSLALTVGTRPTATKVAFFGNYGEGPEALSELNESGVAFDANTTYLIAINLDMIQVIAKR